VYIGCAEFLQKLKKLDTMNIKAELILRPCTPEDLVHWYEGERTTLSRQRFYVRTNNKLECYTISHFSDKRTVLQFMNENRLFIPATEDLAGTHTGTVLQDIAEYAAA